MVGAPRSFEDIARISAYKDLHATIAERSRPVVAFVGSGLSAPAGLPSWPGLKTSLLQELRDKAGRAASASEARTIAENADDIASMTDPWVAFERLESSLGRTTYQAIIRNSLSPADTTDIPQVYNYLWRTPIEGVISVNLDNFVKRSFSEVYPGKDLKWFTGVEAARLARILHGGRPFAYSLHGSIDDADSWVFTHGQLRALYRTRGYKEMLSAIFAGYTVLFLGISADDTAVGGPLERLASSGIQGPTHYWLTDRNDQATDEWAERTGIRLLPYAPIGGDHSIVLAVLKDLSDAVGTEVKAPPVLLPSGGDGSPLPSPDELVVRPLEEIRRLLNDRASQVLAGPGGEDAYGNFLLEYEEAVHRAWFIPNGDGKKELFDYQLEDLVARGAFGQVYRSIGPDGNQVAIKVLREEIRQDPKLLASFRRGVQAMKIIGGHDTTGMVSYESASEIPTFVAMEWIDGPNLADAKKAQLLDDWSEVLWASRELAAVIKRAHDLPERVLHRDIRPANIMLRNGWQVPADWELVVLDFDLSTYRGARQKSVLAQESALGFLAPEQLEVENSSYSTRNAAVDSFGVGMTLLFLCGGTEPEAYAQRRQDFAAVVDKAVSMPANTSWLSLPRRFARIILAATLDEQPRRWDLARILLELNRLKRVHEGGNGPVDTDLVCEELAARCQAIAAFYEWNTDDDSVVVQRPSGLSLTMSGAREEDEIALKIMWAATGTEERSSVAKYLPDRLQRSAKALRSGPWEAVRVDPRKMDAVVTANLNADAGYRMLDAAAQALSQAVEALRFD